MYSLRHLAHCCLLLTVCYLAIALTFYYKDNYPGLFRFKADSISLSFPLAVAFLLSYVGVMARMVGVVFNLSGLFLYECFPGPVQLQVRGGDTRRMPRISFRIVTRGDYPDLVARNVKLIESVSCQVGLKNFIIEIVTEKRMNLKEEIRLRQIVVPDIYRTKNGSHFKARNLQYCLEGTVSVLEDHDWIVHLDEDSALTPDAVKGVANFVLEGKYLLGQGRISYDPENVTGTLTRLLMAYRMSWDNGFLRLFGGCLNKFPFFMKGSFVVCQAGVEKKVSFDGGPTASVIEFLYFAYKANRMGYRCGWVEGQVNELGALNVPQIITQTSRIFYGISAIGGNEVVRGSLRFSHGVNLTLVYGYLTHSVVLAITLILDCESIQGRSLLAMIGLVIGHDFYVGIFWLYKKRAALSWSKMILFLLINTAISPVFINIAYSMSFCISLFQKQPTFAVTKKSL